MATRDFLSPAGCFLAAIRRWSSGKEKGKAVVFLFFFFFFSEGFVLCGDRQRQLLSRGDSGRFRHAASGGCCGGLQPCGCFACAAKFVSGLICL